MEQNSFQRINNQLFRLYRGETPRIEKIVNVNGEDKVLYWLSDGLKSQPVDQLLRYGKR